MGSRHHSRRKHQPSQTQNQVPHKFSVDERVLCYEPDQNKARVLYDSKVLQAVERVDGKGKVRVEYKIHFFGWNSSWDRYVDENCVLKDTDENRALQKELKAKADVLIQSHTKKKKRKKTLSEILKEAIKDNKSGKGTKVGSKEGKNDGDSGGSSSDSDYSDQESSDDDSKEPAKIELTEKMKTILNEDFYNVTKRGMLCHLPAHVSVVCVFEGYVKFLGFRELRKLLEQRKSFKIIGPQPSTASVGISALSANCNKTPSKASSDNWADELDKLYKKVQQAQEIVYGLKTIFDYMLELMLLYKEEDEQFQTIEDKRPKMPVINCSRIIPQLPISGNPLTSTEDIEKDKVEEGIQSSVKSQGTKTTVPCAPTRLRSAASAENALWLSKINAYIKELQSWRMLPVESYHIQEPDPSMVYGLIHLLRFFIKLPEIFNRMLIPMRKLRIIAHHVNQMIEHIQTCYAFSTKTIYQQPFPIHVYEEDQDDFGAPLTGEVSEHEPLIKFEVEPDLTHYSTRNHSDDMLARVTLPLPKAVEVPLTNTVEHQLTVSIESPLKVNKDSTAPPPSPHSSKANRNRSSSRSRSKEQNRGREKMRVIKQEPLSPRSLPPEVDHATPTQTSKSERKATVTVPSPPPQPMVRQVRKSAAHAAFKNAHIFASHQILSAKSLSKRSDFGERSTSRKRRLPKDEPDDSDKLNVNTKKSSPVPQSPSKGSAKDINPSQEEKSKQTSFTRLRSPSGTERCSSPLKEHCRRNSSPRADSPSKKLPSSLSPSPRPKSNSFHKEGGPCKPIMKSTSPTTSIRLRSRSDERQLRSKGGLLNPLSLPINNPCPKPPKRRESTGNRADCHESSSPKREREPSPVRHLRRHRKC